MTLNTKRVAALKKAGRHGDGHGLYLQITPAGVKSWLLRYERNGRERWLGLGPIHTVGLAEARERARRARLLLLDGIDPLEQKAAKRAARALEAARALTFEQAARQYFEQHESKWTSAKHRTSFLTTLSTFVFPTIGRLPVAAIDTGLVLKFLEPIWRNKTVTADRTRRRVEAVLDWATVRGYRAGENPARWKGHLAEVLPARSKIEKLNHHAALPYHELPEFMVALRARESVTARALEFLILTAARTGEVRFARWPEIDLKMRTWTVPAERTKTREKDHRVQLSDRAVELLSALPRDGEYVFSRKGAPLSGMALIGVLQSMKHTDITVHGFRSAFRDWAAERTQYPNHVVEMALAHQIGNAVERAYRRGDLFEKRRRLMNDWAKFATTPVATAAEVVPLRA